MRKPVCKAVLLLLCLYAKQSKATVSSTDTSAIIHAIDGNINEWKTDSFETDKQTQMQFAVDHDATYLFVAVKITDQRTQMRMMAQGMNMYIDRKGKHKEGTGINFPLAQGRDAMRSAFTSKDAQTPPDPKAMREAMANKMVLLKTFGFEDREDKTQMIVDEAGISVSFDWDQADNMYIEYLVPLQFLGKNSDLFGKTISVGWQLNSMPAMGGDAGNASATAATTGRMVSVPAGSAPPATSGGRSGGRGNSFGSAGGSVPRSDSPAKENIFWMKHTLSF